MADYEGRRTLFEVSGDSVTRARKECPKCGPGVFLADHGDRVSCGRCGYTEFTGGKSKQKPEAEPDPGPAEDAEGAEGADEAAAADEGPAEAEGAEDEAASD